jgi:hypothetical protein
MAFIGTTSEQNIKAAHFIITPLIQQYVYKGAEWKGRNVCGACAHTFPLLQFRYSPVNGEPSPKPAINYNLIEGI